MKNAKRNAAAAALAVLAALPCRAMAQDSLSLVCTVSYNDGERMRTNTHVVAIDLANQRFNKTGNGIARGYESGRAVATEGRIRLIHHDGGEDQIDRVTGIWYTCNFPGNPGCVQMFDNAKCVRAERQF